MIIRTLYHFAFWGFFILLFYQQNTDALLESYLWWLNILMVCAIVVYTNIYYLISNYFLKKRYFTYSLLLFLLLCCGTIGLKFIDYLHDILNENSIFQYFVNLLFFIIITSSLKFLREYLKKQEQLLKTENTQLRTELSLLKAQVNPHFLFNTLNNLYGLITQHQHEQAAAITLKLSGLMRYLLESSKAEKVSLHKEVQFLEDYLALERIRLAENTDIRFEASGLDKEVFVAPLLLIPLVENAFKHGLQSISDQNFAHFSLSLQGQELYFEARNSVGKRLSLQEASGTGLANLRKRLALAYPERHLLEIETLNNTFSATLYIKL